MARRRCLWTLPSMRRWSWPRAIKAYPGPNEGIAFDECFRPIWSEENMRIYKILSEPLLYNVCIMFAPIYPLYFVWFWNLSQLSRWIAPLMRFSVETAGPVPLSGATLPCLQMLGTLQRAAVPLLKVGIDQGDPCGKQLVGWRQFGHFLVYVQVPFDEFGQCDWMRFRVKLKHWC